MDVEIVGTKVRVRYQEPSTNKDGSPLTDLGKTSIFWKKVSDGGAGSLVIDVPATSVAGGGAIDLMIDIPVGPDQEADVDIWAVAYDITGNPSDTSTIKVVRIDHLPPSAPI